VGAENARTGKTMAEKMIKIMEERLQEKAAVTDKLHCKNHALKVLRCILLVACCMCLLYLFHHYQHKVTFYHSPHAMIDYLASALATIVWVSVCGLVQDQHLCPDA